MKTKSPPPDLTRSEFYEHAWPMLAKLAGHTLEVTPKKFSTKSVGWHGQEKLVVELKNGKRVQCVVNMLVTVVGSKEIDDG